MKVIYAISLLIFVAAFNTACKKPPLVETETVQRRTLVATVSESGQVFPNFEVTISPEISGEITAIYVKEGQQVHKGELLMEIRPDNLKAAYEQAQAALNAAKAELENADAVLRQREIALQQDSINLARSLTLLKDSIISKSEYENALLQFRTSKQNIEVSKKTKSAAYFRVMNAEANTRQSYDQLSRTRIYASMDGTITKLQVKQGQRVVGTGMMTGTEAIVISDLSVLHVRVLINENDITNVHIGDSASIEIEALGLTNLKGQIQEISFLAEKQEVGTTDQVTNYSVKITIVNADSMSAKRIRPGMTATATVYTHRATSVPSVPIRAVTIDRNMKDKENINKEIVFTINAENKTVKRNVVTGISNEEYIEIKSGLSERDVVITGPYSLLHRELNENQAVTTAESVKE